MTWIALEGACNARDVGGLPTVDGRVTKSGVLLRADNLQGLTPGDCQVLSHVGTVLDLRTSAEVEILGPGPLRHAGTPHVHLDLIPHGFDGRPLVEATIPDETAGEHSIVGQTHMQKLWTPGEPKPCCGCPCE